VLLVVESDEVFISIEEIKQATNFNVAGTSLKDFQAEQQNSNQFSPR